MNGYNAIEWGLIPWVFMPYIFSARTEAACKISDNNQAFVRRPPSRVIQKCAQTRYWFYFWRSGQCLTGNKKEYCLRYEIFDFHGYLLVTSNESANRAATELPKTTEIPNARNDR